MISEIGHFSLILATFIAAILIILSQLGRISGDQRLLQTAIPASYLLCACLTLAFICLIYGFVISDFSLQIVAQNSHSDKPLLYKISGVWGNHEGSMLLWIFCLTFFGAAIAYFGKSLPLSLKSRILSVQALLTFGFLLFLLLTSNPFWRLIPAPTNGAGLNPLLQDPGLAFHPPMLYLGYVGLSVCFSFSIAALWEGRIDPAWGRWVRPWTLAAWVFLTGGIGLGSWWAYYELGWGGWWYWDPVENASFMPWLIATALFHSASVVEKRDSFKRWTVLLAILAFSLSLIGTFLVRSGVLTSVHAFAVDPERGVFILFLLALVIGGSLALYAWRAPTISGGKLFAVISRESSLVLNNMFLVIATATVFLGTLYPLLLETMGGGTVSVGPSYYNATFVPIMVPLVFVMAIGPFLPWKRADLRYIAPRLLICAVGAFVGGMAILFLEPSIIGVTQSDLSGAVTILGQAVSGGLKMPMAAFGIGAALWLILATVMEWMKRIKLGQEKLSASWRRARLLPRASYGMSIAHIGMAVLIAGVMGASFWKSEDVRYMDIGEKWQLGPWEIQLDQVQEIRGENYQSYEAQIQLKRDQESIAVLTPEKRVYLVQNMPTSEAAIETDFITDFYLVLGDQNKQGQWTVRIFIEPLVPWIFIGIILMMIGGAVSLSDRRYRLALPARAVRP